MTDEEMTAMLDLLGYYPRVWEAENVKGLWYPDVKHKTEWGTVRDACAMWGYEAAMETMRGWIAAGCPLHDMFEDQRFVLSTYPGSRLYGDGIQLVGNSYNGEPDESD